VNIVHQLVAKLRSGEISGSGPGFSTVVGVGHSLGSIITQGVTAQFPSDLGKTALRLTSTWLAADQYVTDATVLTGFAYGTEPHSFAVFLAAQNLAIPSTNAPYRFTDENLPQGYFVWGTEISQQLGFFRAPNFDPAIVALAEGTKATGTFGEFFTLSLIAPALNYTRPLAVVNGDSDIPDCFGNCTYPTDLSQAVFDNLYPEVTADKQAKYLAPHTGHGLNLHYTGEDAFRFAQEFLVAQL